MDLRQTSFFKASVLILIPFAVKIWSLPNTGCGKLNSDNEIPWIVGIYLEGENGHLELVCLGTVLNSHYVITATQCVCETLSNDVRKENIYVSKEIKKISGLKENTIKIKHENVMKPKEYQGFLLEPLGDIAILKLRADELPSSSVCVDWADLTELLQAKATGISSFWENEVNYDLCRSLTSDNFGSILGSDKNCFKTSKLNLVRQATGSGIYYQNAKNGKWYIEGVVSGSETVGEEVFLAATSTRRYLSWLSHTCATQ